VTRTLHHYIGDDDIYCHMTLWLDREHVDIYWQPPPPRNITHEMYYYTKYGSLPSERDGRLGMSTARTSSKYLLSKILKLRKRNGCMYNDHICPDPSCQIDFEYSYLLRAVWPDRPRILISNKLDSPRPRSPSNAFPNSSPKHLN
jgi:hypothetical protein